MYSYSFLTKLASVIGTPFLKRSPQKCLPFAGRSYRSSHWAAVNYSAEAVLLELPL